MLYWVLVKSLVKYLQRHLAGEILAGDDVLDAFSIDGSLIKDRPLGVVYARSQKDVRKTLLFLSQVAIKGQTIPLTVRGGGSDLSGAAVGSGLILLTPAYLNQVLKSNERKAIYKLEAGCAIGELRSFLADRGNFLPAAFNLPASATLGGALANNASSKYSTKYGLMSEQVESLKVVLANGEFIEISKLSHNKVLKKLTLDTFEGDIYRELDRLFYSDDSPYYYKTSPIFERIGRATRSLPAYDLSQVCSKDGSLNLIPLFAGSQGTLGIITEVEIKCRAYNKTPQALILKCADMKVCPQLVEEIKELKPSAITMVNGACFAKLKSLAPLLLKEFASLEKCEIVLIVEFDDFSLQKLYKKIKKTELIADELGVNCEAVKSAEAYENLDRLRTALGVILSESSTAGRYVYGGFRGAYIPLLNWVNFYAQARLLFKNHKMDFLVFGEIGFNQFNVLPKFDLRTTASQRHFLKFLSDYCELIVRHGGRLSLERQEGSLLGQFISRNVGDEDYQLLKTIKSLFDPYNILNPQIKLGAAGADVAKRLQPAINWDRFHHRLARLS